MYTCMCVICIYTCMPLKSILAGVWVLGAFEREQVWHDMYMYGVYI
jgi:hypothetical protein